MSIAFTVSDWVPAPPSKVYAAWLDSEGHSAMTGSPAKASAVIGTTFEAWDGYISGMNLELEPDKRILQTWRTTEFDPADEDSLLEILFEEMDGGTNVTINHSRLPEDGEQYLQGWLDFYFEPMKSYFS